MGLVWNMPVPVACSLAVAAGGLAASCGQCPLDDAGRVLDPGDARAQAVRVAAMARGALDHLPDARHAALLVAYHDADDPADVVAPLAAAFPGAVIAPVRLPHFYYPGMRVEVDVYAQSARPRRTTLSQGAAHLSLVEGGPLTLAWLSAPAMAGALPLLARVDPARLLAAQWCSAEAPPAALAPDPAARVIPPGGAGTSAVFLIAPGPVAAAVTPGGAVLRRAGPFAWAAAHGTAADLAQAAHQAMDALALPGMPGFVPLKATTHYAGGPGPQDLHGNLAVRHARFPRPGPASTGVPVAGLAGARLAIDMLGWIDSPAVSA